VIDHHRKPTSLRLQTLPDTVELSADITVHLARRRAL
jgi:hypothetical protein